MEPMTIVAAADGSALGNPGPAGWAWFVDENCWRAGGWPHGTNNQGELMAVLDLLRSTEHVADQPLRILCDSQYVINCITKWMPGWKRKGWRKADGKPVLNVDLLKDIDAAIVGRSYTFEWVKGHAGHPLNEAADERARAVATAYQARTPVPAGPGFQGAPAPDEPNPVAVPAFASPAASTSPAAATRPVAAASAVRPTSTGSRGARAGLSAVDPEDAPDLFSTLLEEEFLPDSPSEADQVIALEEQLLDPEVRADAGRLAVLLDPDFEEFGTSGRAWNRDTMLAALDDDPSTAASMQVLNVQVFDGATALLTYRTTDRRGSALRSSVWRHTDGQWRLRFHQGTPEV
jgi:ribonuclease HI